MFDSTSNAAVGRMLARVLTALSDSWWFNTNCIVDGMLGLNFFDIGSCSGKLVVIILDVTLGWDYFLILSLYFLILLIIKIYIISVHFKVFKI